MRDPLRSAMRAVVVFLALVLALPGCDASQDIVDPEIEGTLDGMAAAETGIPTRPYVFIHENGEQMGVEVDPSTDQLKEVYFSAPNAEFVVSFGPDGMPTQMTIGEAVVVYENVREDLADLALISPDGETLVFRDVPVDPDAVAAVRAFAEARRGTQPPSFSEVFNAAALGVGLVGCSFIGVSGLAATAGTALPPVFQATVAGVIACGGTIVAVYQERQRRNGVTDQELRSSSATVTIVSTAANAQDCRGLSPTACGELLMTGLGGLATVLENARQTLGLAIEAARGLLYGTGGDVEIVLSWNNEADLDLWVSDPSGERIWFRNRTSVSGGILEFDDTDGFGPERVYWPSGQAPPGVYTIQVDHYSGPSSANWRVLRVVDGRAEPYSGRIFDDQTVTVAQFVVQAPREASAASAGPTLAGPAAAVPTHAFGAEEGASK